MEKCSFPRKNPLPGLPWDPDAGISGVSEIPVWWEAKHSLIPDDPCLSHIFLGKGLCDPGEVERVERE